jgi:aminoglycoside 3-N-acetyltransferase I
MEIQKLQSTELADFKKLIRIFNLVFENEDVVADDLYLQKLIANPDFIVFVVRMDGKIVGGLTVYVLHQYYHNKPQAYIYDVGIDPEFQGRGLGKKLMSEVCDYFRTNGFDQAYVEAESEDLEAIRFYRQTPFSHEMGAVHFTYSFSGEGP